MNVEKYLAQLDPRQKVEYERILGLVRRIVPDVQEVISYGVIALKDKKDYIIWFGGFKDHMSLYPGAPDFLRKKLEGHKLAKGTIQFTYDSPLSDELIMEFVEWRLAENVKKHEKQ